MLTKRGLHPTAYQIEDDQEFVPYVQDENVAEMTLVAVGAGMFLGVVFGAANAYLGLMAGLTISTSIPVAVLTVVFFRFLGAFGREHTILEANMSQTVGSASSSVASGVLFTIPALFMWGVKPPLLQLTALAMAGGLIGILAMIPLRRYLIRREHGRLPYPEGLACAEVLVASKEGGAGATGVFWGLGAGFLFKLLTDGFKVVGKTLSVSVGKATAAIQVSPALIGVGFILGPRVAGVMVAGSAVSSFVLIPIIAWWGHDLGQPVYPETVHLIRDMSASAIWNRYVRYIGAGAVAAAGIMTLVSSIPTMVESFRLGVKQMGSGADSGQVPRTDRDLPFGVVIAGVGLVLAMLVFVPGVLGSLDSLLVKSVAALLIAVFAFFFVTVASRIVGMVGVTSNPTSGMTIATLLGTSFVFYSCGWTDLAGKATALMVGTTVCIAASIAGDTSQDLKTGFLLGATPRYQQIGELVGVLTSSFFVCWTVVALDRSMGVGSAELPAPQGTLMKLVINGVIDQNLPWSLIGLGVVLAVVAAVARLPALAFAVGIYLPLATMSPVFLGGLLQYAVTRKVAAEVAGARRERGVLFGSGLVGGEGLMGVGLALWVLAQDGSRITGYGASWSPGLQSLTAGLGLLAIIGLILRATINGGDEPPCAGASE